MYKIQGLILLAQIWLFSLLVAQQKDTTLTVLHYN